MKDLCFWRAFVCRVEQGSSKKSSCWEDPSIPPLLEDLFQSYCCPIITQEGEREIWRERGGERGGERDLARHGYFKLLDG